MNNSYNKFVIMLGNNNERINNEKTTSIYIMFSLYNF